MLAGVDCRLLEVEAAEETTELEDLTVLIDSGMTSRPRQSALHEAKVVYTIYVEHAS